MYNRIMEKYIEQRPWGDFERFTLNELSTVKIITVKAGEAFSLQYHNNRSEFWKILKGQGLVTLGDETHETKEGEEIFIPQNTNHRMQGLTDISFLEIAFGEFDENDIVRLEDKYDRK
jgi:mannose-6-phosphate isomerase-like protein (cupin superfamily)